MAEVKKKIPVLIEKPDLLSKDEDLTIPVEKITEKENKKYKKFIVSLLVLTMLGGITVFYDSNKDENSSPPPTTALTRAVETQMVPEIIATDEIIIQNIGLNLFHPSSTRIETDQETRIINLIVKGDGEYEIEIDGEIFCSITYNREVTENMTHTTLSIIQPAGLGSCSVDRETGKVDLEVPLKEPNTPGINIISDSR